MYIFIHMSIDFSVCSMQHRLFPLKTCVDLAYNYAIYMCTHVTSIHTSPVLDVTPAVYKC
jgi:hypothetical protein